MNIREAIKQAVLAINAIAVLVGDRVWFGYMPTGGDAVGPWVVITRISSQREAAMSGDQGLLHGVYQFTVGGQNKVNVDIVQDRLARLNATNFAFQGKVLTFFHRGDRDAWDDGNRVQDPSVDLEVWVEE